MSTEAPAQTASEPTSVRYRWWQRRWITVAVVSVVVIGLASYAIGRVVYAHTYQPLEHGEFESIGGLNAKPLSDGVDDSTNAVFGPAGTQARVELSLRNNGSHEVRLLGLPAGSAIDRIAWGPYLDRSQYLGGTVAEARPFPVTLRAHGEISIWVYVTKPNCTGGGTDTLTSVPLRWSALGATHVYSIALDSGFPSLMLCPARSALKDIDPQSN
jgi:hypothetical protein